MRTFWLEPEPEKPKYKLQRINPELKRLMYESLDMVCDDMSLEELAECCGSVEDMFKPHRTAVSG
jgi:hypothetical protein